MQQSTRLDMRVFVGDTDRFTGFCEFVNYVVSTYRKGFPLPDIVRLVGPSPPPLSARTLPRGDSVVIPTHIARACAYLRKVGVEMGQDGVRELFAHLNRLSTEQHAEMIHHALESTVRVHVYL
jgi:hypothetical protein